MLVQMVEEAAEPRRAASVKKVLEKKSPAAVSAGTLGGTKGGKARAAKLPANIRSLMARKAGKPRRKSHSFNLALSPTGKV
jgi:hypothetical protein